MGTNALILGLAVVVTYLVTKNLCCKCPEQPSSNYLLEDTSFMFIVKGDHPDVNYSIDFTAVDSEGVRVPEAELDVLVESDNPDAVEVVEDVDDPKKGTVHFGRASEDGTPALANITATVVKSDGTTLGVFGAQFTITAGDVSAIQGGTIKFEGLTEA